MTDMEKSTLTASRTAVSDHTATRSHAAALLGGITRIGGKLSLAALVRTFEGGARGVDDVSLEIGAGELVTLLGPSGSGKTTMLKMVAGFERPDSGTIRLGDRDLTTVAPHRRDVGMVFQNYALFPHMSVAENIAFPLAMRRKSKAEISAAVERMLALVHLPGLGGRLPRQLSGGQQQRVALARALVFSPALLLMDEPLGALDRQLRRQVQSEIKRIQRALGITVLFVTHDQEEALFLSDRIAVMNAGRIAQIGPPLDLYTHPADRFVAEFLGEPNVLSGTAAGRDGPFIRVALPGGTALLGRPMSGADVTARVDLLLRPERVAIVPRGVTEPNIVPARIELVNFLGDTVELETVIDADAQIRIRVPYRSDMPQWSPGDTIALSFSPDDGLVFPAKVMP